MNKTPTFALAISSAILACVAASPADTLIETFDNGSNIGAWTWGFGDTIANDPGPHGPYLRADGLDTFAPQPRATATNTLFTGDYRTNGVTCVGVDLITHNVDFSTGGRPLTLMLMHDNGTPKVFEDDTAAYFMHAQNIPAEGAGWSSYSFSVPSDSTTLPAGWQLLNMGDSGSPAIHTWDQVIQNVTGIRFFYGNPTFFFIFQQWSVGLDNITLCHTPTPNCPADIDNSGSVDVNDLLAVIGAWGATGANPADITGDQVVDVNDLLAVVGGWGACP
jgi:hypothetical protein